MSRQLETQDRLSQCLRSEHGFTGPEKVLALVVALALILMVTKIILWGSEQGALKAKATLEGRAAETSTLALNSAEPTMVNAPVAAQVGASAGGCSGDPGHGNGTPSTTPKPSPEPTPTPPPQVSADQLRETMPGLSSKKADEYLPDLNKAMNEFGITTPERKAAFLAQLGHESLDLRYFEEIASGEAYEGRADLGNTQPGDGVRYKGRGPIQLTGRANYRAAGKALGLDLEGHPELASTPEVGFRIAGWFWQKNGLNDFADKGDFASITRRINGGNNGAADRNERYERAKKTFGVK